jgi:hypothetical protein
MPNLYHSPLQRAFRAAALCFLLVRVAWPRLAPSYSTAIRLSFVSAIDRSRIGQTPHARLAAPKLPQPCDTLLPLLPDS